MADRFGPNGPTAELLCSSLELAVPLRIAEYQAAGHTDAWLQARAAWAAELIAAHGDVLLYRRPARTRNGASLPGSAEVFNALAEGLAAAALLAPGGIRFLGVAFIPPGGPQPDVVEPDRGDRPPAVTAPDYRGCNSEGDRR